MMFSTVSWKGVDTANAEFSWKAPEWYAVLNILARYEGVRYDDFESSVYDELKDAVSAVSWISDENGRKRSFFRDSAVAWKQTGVLSLESGVFEITPLGRAVLSGQISYTELLLRLLTSHHENNGEKSYAIVANAFLCAANPLSLKEIFFGVMRDYRPNTENDFDEIMQKAKENTSDMESTARRRLRNILTSLERVNAIARNGNRDETWVAWDRAVLLRLANSYQRVESMPDNIEMIVNAVLQDFLNAGLVYDPNLIQRFIAALFTKPFVILTGLSGSGKTKLAQAFAKWIADETAIQIVAVGSDWTSSEYILGYPNALSSNEYVRTPALDIIIKAAANPQHPYFLILDEMNLSHVERYFADILSAIESGGAIHLHSGPDLTRSDIPQSISLPTNLFIIGTVNVDETTYMFSPKVLDRANTLEFRVTKTSINYFLSDPTHPNLDQLAGLGQQYAEEFVIAARQRVLMQSYQKQMFEQEMAMFFDVLQQHGAEFGFRTANEIARFVAYYTALSPTDDSYQQAIDAQILQKILPKLHGSSRQLEPILCALAHLCHQVRVWEEIDGQIQLTNASDLITAANNAAKLDDESLHPLYRNSAGELSWPLTTDLPLRLSYEKIFRMLQRLQASGFTSFAEA